MTETRRHKHTPPNRREANTVPWSYGWYCPAPTRVSKSTLYIHQTGHLLTYHQKHSQVVQYIVTVCVRFLPSGAWPGQQKTQRPPQVWIPPPQVWKQKSRTSQNPRPCWSLAQATTNRKRPTLPEGNKSREREGIEKTGRIVVQKKNREFFFSVVVDPDPTPNLLPPLSFWTVDVVQKYDTISGLTLYCFVLWNWTHYPHQGLFEVHVSSHNICSFCCLSLKTWQLLFSLCSGRSSHIDSQHVISAGNVKRESVFSPANQK